MVAVTSPSGKVKLSPGPPGLLAAFEALCWGTTWPCRNGLQRP